MGRNRRGHARVASRIVVAIVVPATLVGVSAPAWADTVVGTDGDDTGDTALVGTDGADYISGEPGGVPTVDGGDDVIDALGGDDVVVGDGNAANPNGQAVVVGHDDTITGGSGDDRLYGDGYASGTATAIVGGDDEIHGGDGDDTIIGDGADDGSVAGFVAGAHLLQGGDDMLYGDAGNDVIYGDADPDSASQDSLAPPDAVDPASLGVVVVEGGTGGDELYGGDGDDELYGQDGNDLLCGGPGDDLLIGGAGEDLACAVDDAITVDAGESASVQLAANDEVLDDEDLEIHDVVYALEDVPAGVTVTAFDPASGEIEFTATSSGTIVYSVTREYELPVRDARLAAALTATGLPLSLARLLVTVTAEPPSPPPVINPADDTGAQAAPTEPPLDVLPATGLADHLGPLGATGAGLVLAGALLAGMGARQRRTS